MQKQVEMTLCFPVRNGRVLLGKKNRGLGAGYWNGPGGHVEEGEGHMACAVRELREEFGLEARPDSLEYRGSSVFHNPPGKYAEVKVYNYVCTEWDGDPSPNDEMDELRTFSLRPFELPLDLMWQDDGIWLVPVLLHGMTVYGEYWFFDDGKLCKSEVRHFPHARDSRNAGRKEPG